jgi:hypothetical protein
MRPGDLGYRFGEDLSDAGWIPASEAANLQPQLYRTSLPGQVLETTLVLRMAVSRCLATARTMNLLLNLRVKQKAIVRAFDLVQDQIVSRQDRLRMARGSRHCKMSLKQYRTELFGPISARRCCTESAEDPILTLRRHS